MNPKVIEITHCIDGSLENFDFSEIDQDGADLVVAHLRLKIAEDQHNAHWTEPRAAVNETQS